jgi:hypothetical protein
MALPLINGRAYDYTQIIFPILGVPVSGVSKISYKEEQEVAGNKGTGEYDVSVGFGGINSSGSVEISMNDIESLRDVAPIRGSLLSLPFFDIPVIFGTIQGVQTHVLKNCKFKNDGVDTSQGDTDIKFTYDLYISHINYR